MIARLVCVLGEPRLTWESGEAVVPGRPGRLLVAMLVREGGASLDQLAELVWSGDPPKTARSALHVHLGTLRQLFSEVPEGLTITRQGDRYAVRRSGWDLDVELVAELSAKAKELLAVDAADDAAVQLQRALDMFTGDPFTVGGVEVSATATYQLELVRLDLEEQLVEALLLAGDVNRAEMLAVQAVDSEPYRERRWGQLMRARAQQGRAGDALAAFEMARDILERDLGVGPGEELSRLERSVLTHDVMATRSRPAQPVALGEVPPPFGDLVGRGLLVERVETALARGTPVLLCGAPGAGKTRVAVEVARRAASGGRAVSWVDLRNSAFDQQASGDAVIRWARQNAGGMVVLDNAERAIERVTDLVADCRRVAPSVQALVTSRIRMPGPFAIATVDPLPVPIGDDPEQAERSESVQLLRSLLALLAPDVGLDTVAAATLCRQLGGLPLAIRMAADLARSVPVREIAAASRARLGPDLEGAVASSLDRLGPQHRDAFAAVSVVAGQLDAELAAALIGGPAARGQLSQLVDHGLVQFSAEADAPYSVPEPLRDVGATLLSESARRDALDRLCDECVARAQARTRPTPTTPSGRRLEDLLRRELPWHRQCLDHLADVVDDRRALALVAALELQLYSLGWWQDNLELQDLALSIPGEPSAVRAHVHAVRGRPGQFHQFDEEHNQSALAMAIEVGDPATRALALYHLGVMRWWAKEYDEALGMLERVRADAEELGDVLLAGQSMRFIGMALVTAGEHDRGLTTQLELIHLVERMRGMEILLPHLYMHLGHSRRHAGDVEAALVDLSVARAGFEALGNRASLIHVCAGLAEVNADLGRCDDALEAAARALDVSAGSTIDVYDPWTFCTSARVHLALGDDELARRAAGRAIDALNRTFDGETHRVAVELSSIASGLGEHRAALRLAGLAEANPDRRELPFRSPLEQQRLRAAVDAARRALGAEADAVIVAGAGSSLAEAAALLTHPTAPAPGVSGSRSS